MDAFIRNFELEDSYRVESARGYTALHFETSRTEDDNLYSFAVVRGLKHQFPNGKNHRLVAADLFWTFFCDNTPSGTTR